MVAHLFFVKIEFFFIDSRKMRSYIEYIVHSQCEEAKLRGGWTRGAEIRARVLLLSGCTTHTDETARTPRRVWLVRIGTFGGGNVK